VVDVTPNLELLVTFDMSLERVCHELYAQFEYKLITNLEGASCCQKFLEKARALIGMRKL
jgi:hypothetical protein